MTLLRPDPASETALDRGRARVGALLAAVVLVLAASGLAGPGAAPASAAPRQDPGASTTLEPTVTTGGSGLVTTTAAVTPTTATATATGPNSNKVAEEDRKIWLVVGGLVAVALALLLLTIRYWRQTKPVPVSASPAAEEAAVTGRRARRAERGRHSRRAVAGADHAAADEEWEPRGTGEHERIEVPASTGHRPTAEQRAAAYAAATRPR